MCVYIYIYICVYVDACVCVCVYACIPVCVLFFYLCSSDVVLLKECIAPFLPVWNSGLRVCDQRLAFGGFEGFRGV